MKERTLGDTMSSSEKADKCLEKIIFHIDFRNPFHPRIDKYALKASIQNVIDANLEYLLTDSYLYFLADAYINHQTDLSLIFEALLNPSERLKCIYNYFTIISISYFSGVENVMKGYEKKLYLLFKKKVADIEKLCKDTGDYNFIFKIFRIILTYVFVNKEPVSKFDEYTNPYFKDLYSMIDDMLFKSGCEYQYDCCNEENSYIFKSDELIESVVNSFKEEREGKVIL